MATDPERTHNLAFTGGTMTMGYVSGAFLKKLSDEYASLNDEGQYLYPLYDVRHIALAGYIDASTSLSQPQKNELYERLVETGSLEQELQLAKKERPGEVAALEAKLDRTLDDIAGKIDKGLTVHAVLQSYGLDESRVTTPYFIDSINYDERTHDEKLYAAAKEALLGKKDQTFFVVGGTDSLVMYAGKLTRRLIDEGIISEESGNKVIFLSAMKSFGYGPEGIRETLEGEVKKWKRENKPFMTPPELPENPHITNHPQYIGKLFYKAMELGKKTEPGKAALPAGGYLLCPQTEDCYAIGVHDARESMKVYYKWIDAFRSKSWYVGVLEDGHPLKLNPEYHPAYKATSSPDEKVDHVEIAPPLINGNSRVAILSYLLKMRDKPVMIVGGDLTGTGLTPVPDDYQALDASPSAAYLFLNNIDPLAETTFDVIRERAQRGVPTYYVNPDMYDINTNKMHPMIDEKEWRRSALIGEAQQAGAIALSGNTLIGTYHDIKRTLGKLTQVEGVEKIKRAGGVIKRELKKDLPDMDIPVLERAPVGIEYIPDHKAFEDGFRAAAECSKKVVINALPAGVLPGYVAPLVEKYSKDHYIIAGYEYASAYRRYTQFTGRFEEVERPSYEWAAHAKPVSDYAPAIAFSQAGGHDCGYWTPSEIMYRLPYQELGSPGAETRQGVSTQARR